MSRQVDAIWTARDPGELRRCSECGGFSRSLEDKPTRGDALTARITVFFRTYVCPKGHEVYVEWADVEHMRLPSERRATA